VTERAAFDMAKVVAALLSIIVLVACSRGSRPDAATSRSHPTASASRTTETAVSVPGPRVPSKFKGALKSPLYRLTVVFCRNYFREYSRAGMARQLGAASTRPVALARAYAGKARGADYWALFKGCIVGIKTAT
jgi:hypothetical protein